MGKFLNQRKKIILAIFLVIISITMIKFFSNKNIAQIQEQREQDSIIKVKYGSKIYESKTSKKDINNTLNTIQVDDTKSKTTQNKVIIKDNKEDSNFISKVKDNLCNLLNINKNVEIDTKDKEAPDNVNKIDVKVLEDNAIINFSEPKDNGTDYEYIVENEDKEERLNFHSESGIYGYSYRISNDEKTKADEFANKLDNSPIILQNIDWNKDYFLHIRTIDKSNNISENKTIKINLPSFGARIEYIDKTNQMSLSMSEKINGMIGDNYDAKNKIKEIQGYTLVSSIGESEGKLKRELTTIKFEYAKNAKLNIRYIDEMTKNEIASSNEIDCYIGKEIELNPKIVDGYFPNETRKNIKITNEDNEIIFTYRKFENKIEIKDDTNNALNQDISTIQNNESQNKIQKEDVKKSIESIDNLKEDKSKKIKIRYIDINTNKVLLEDNVMIGEEKQIKYKLKKIEGYKLVSNIDDDKDKDETGIMDEIINSLDIEDDIKKDKSNGLTLEEKRKVIAQYEIVMNCDESDYIIYYKK